MKLDADTLPERSENERVIHGIVSLVADQYSTKDTHNAFLAACHEAIQLYAAAIQPKVQELEALRTENAELREINRVANEHIGSIAEECKTYAATAAHMASCRALLNVPDDEVLYMAIKNLQLRRKAREAGDVAIWNALQAMAPWAESNDMDWADEILCGLSFVAEEMRLGREARIQLEAWQTQFGTTQLTHAAARLEAAEKAAQHEH
jgi:hypothetical protein